MNQPRSEQIAWCASWFAQTLHTLKMRGELRIATMFEKAAEEILLLADDPLRGASEILAPSPELMAQLLKETLRTTPELKRAPLSSFAGERNE